MATSSRAGRLTVVGTGIGARRHIIGPAVAAIGDAELVLHQIDDPVTAAWLAATNATTRAVFEQADASTLSTSVYEAIAQEVADEVVAGADVCFVTYGHPGVYQHAAHRAIELVRAAGLRGEMLPGVSALDCLIADVGVDIATGCTVLDATAIVLQNKQLDPSLDLVVFQIGIFGNPYVGAQQPVGIDLLADRLITAWGSDHRAIIYEAPMTNDEPPTIEPITLDELAHAELTARSMLYVAALEPDPIDMVAAAQLAARLAEQSL
ncbi:MAG: SAM-dependent methyltransferase [Actinomycetota bacterium]